MLEAKEIVRNIQTVNDPIVSRQFRGHDKISNAVSFDPNMRQLASGGEDSIVYVYSFKPQGRAFKFVGHIGNVYSVAFSHDGNIIASGGEDRTIKFWKNNVYGKCHSIKGHVGSVKSLSFSSDSGILVSSSDDKTIKGWNVPKHKFMFTMPGHKNWVRSSKIAPDARLVVSGSDDHTVRLWDVETSKELQCFRDFTEAVYSVDWISDGTTVCGGDSNGKLNLWDVRSMRLIQHYDVSQKSKEYPQTGVNSISVHPSGNYLLTGSEDSKLKIFDLRQGRLGWTLYSHKGGVKNVTFNKAGDYFASCGLDSTCLVWLSNFDQSFKPSNVVNFVDQQRTGTGLNSSSYSYNAGGLITQTHFKANKAYQPPLTQSQVKESKDNQENTIIYKTPLEKRQENMAEALSGRFEKIVNQMDRITELIVKLDTRISSNEAEVQKLYQNPKAIKLVAKYEEMYKEIWPKYSVFEGYKQSKTQKVKEQIELKEFSESLEKELGQPVGPIFDTGSFMRRELVDDFPEESDKKLQEEYERERRQQLQNESPSRYGNSYGDQQFNHTNPFVQGALGGTIDQDQSTLQQTFALRQNLQESLSGLSDWRQQYEALHRDLEPIVQENEQIIREEQEEDENENENETVQAPQHQQLLLENLDDSQDDQANQGEDGATNNFQQQNLQGEEGVEDDQQEYEQGQQEQDY